MITRLFLKLSLSSLALLAAPIMTSAFADGIPNRGCEFDLPFLYVKSFGAGLGYHGCKADRSLRSLQIVDENLSKENNGVIFSYVTDNKNLKLFWEDVTNYSDDPYWSDLLDLGRNYFNTKSENSLQQLLDYIHTIEAKLNAPNSKSKTITCESINNQKNTCEFGLDLLDQYGAEVTLTGQLSRSSCTLGKSYWTWENSVSVSHGCRATFQVKY
jgi:hypothetical protein